MREYPMAKTVGIICKHDKPEAVQAASELIKWLGERGVDTLLDADAASRCGREGTPKIKIPDLADVIVVFGGDGTLLSVVRLVGERGIPIVGVNLGTLGFITTVPLEDVYPTMETVLSGQYAVQERMMLTAMLKRGGKAIEKLHVLNDIVINKGALARIIDMEVFIDGSLLASFRADGLIINTPTGSTGYSLSAGGPVVHPALSCLGITPICPHTLTNRPLLVPDSAVLEVKLTSGWEDVYLTLDGQVGTLIGTDDVLEARKAEHKAYFILSPNDDYFQMLRTKLRWGGRL